MLFSLFLPLALGAVGVLASFQWAGDSRSLAGTYECGFPAFGGGRRSVPMYFFLVAVLFLLFDVELLVLMPIGGALLGPWGGLGLFLFFFILTAGFWYEWRAGALEESSS